MSFSFRAGEIPVEVKKEIKTENGDASGIPLLPDFDAITAAESGTRVLARNVHSDYQALAVKVQLVLDVQLKKLGIWIPPVVRLNVTCPNPCQH